MTDYRAIAEQVTNETLNPTDPPAPPLRPQGRDREWEEGVKTAPLEDFYPGVEPGAFEKEAQEQDAEQQRQLQDELDRRSGALDAERDPSRMVTPDQAKDLAILPPERRIEVVAKMLYPDEPLETSRTKFREVDNGEIVMWTSEGWFTVRPVAEGMQPTGTQTFGGKGQVPAFEAPTFDPEERKRVKSSIARDVGSAAGDVVGAVAGGAVGAPGGPAGAAAGATTGAIIGGGVGRALGNELTRQGANRVLKEHGLATEPYSIAGSAGSAALGSAESALGIGAAKVVGRLPKTGNIPRHEGAQEALDLQRRAEELSAPGKPIRLTPDELLPRNRDMQAKRVRTEKGRVGYEIMIDHLKQRNEAVADTVQMHLDQVSAQKGAYAASKSGVKGAEMASQRVRENLSRAAQPLYRQAETEMVDLTPYFGKMREIYHQNDVARSSSLGRTLDRLMVFLLEDSAGQMGKTGDPVSVARIDSTKKWLDRTIQRGSDNNTTLSARDVKVLKQLRAEMLAVADEQVPVYAKARSIYEEGVEPVLGKAELLDDLAKHSGFDVIKASGKLFGTQSDPELIRMARTAYQEAGHEDAYNDLLRAHLESVWDNIPKTEPGYVLNPGAAYSQKIYGGNQANFQAATDHLPEFQENFIWLMQVLDATKAVGQRKIRADPALTSKAPNILGGAVNFILGLLGEEAQNQFGKRAAQVLTDPDTLRKLSKQRKFDPRSEAAIVAVAKILEPLEAQEEE